MSGLPADNFSVRWTGSAEFEAGVYAFSVTVDDGVRLWVDGNLIIDQWQEQAETTFTTQTYLSKGVHHIQMAYFEAGGLAVAKLNWQLVTADNTSQTVTWTAEYFNNRDLSGNPAKTQQEPGIDYDWGTGAPLDGLPADNFSVRWTSNIEFLAGTERFTVTVDDGVRVWVDGDLIINEWHEQSPTTYTATKELSAGSHRVQVAYFEATGFAVAKLQWHLETPGPGPGPTPSATLFIDNLDENFTWGGPLIYRHVAPGGQKSSFFWTKNTVFYPENYGKWTPTFAQGGRYEVFVFIPATNATTTNIRYRILHNGQRHDVKINQARYSNEWVSLGTYTFNGNNNGKEFILAYDNTREYYASRQIAFDAVKLVAQ